MVGLCRAIGEGEGGGPKKVTYIFGVPHMEAVSKHSTQVPKGDHTHVCPKADHTHVWLEWFPIVLWFT